MPTATEEYHEIANKVGAIAVSSRPGVLGGRMEVAFRASGQGHIGMGHSIVSSMKRFHISFRSCRSLVSPKYVDK